MRAPHWVRRRRLRGYVSFRGANQVARDCSLFERHSSVSCFLLHLPRHISQSAKMAAHIGRINLLPSTRTLASGAPLARGISLAVPAAGDAHSHGHDGQAGPRPDIPAAWAFKAGARGHIGRTNGEYYAGQKELAEGRVEKGKGRCVEAGRRWTNHKSRLTNN